MICRHCNTKRANRPRGLCWDCYYRPGVRDLYPIESKYGRQGLPDTPGPSKPASKPTSAPGQSPEKVDEMCRRARNGESLFHPDDGPPVDLS